MNLPAARMEKSASKLVSAHAELLRLIMLGMQADLNDYPRLSTYLAYQFDAIVAHESTKLKEVGALISDLVGVLDLRRQERVKLVAKLLGPNRQPTMTVLFKVLPGQYKQSMSSLWQQLESMIKDCKDLNARNCKLLMDQHDLMQRVLNGEADTYAPV